MKPKSSQKNSSSESDDVHITVEDKRRPKKSSKCFQLFSWFRQVPRTKVRDISQLQKGTHLMWKRYYLIWHHGIVLDVNGDTVDVMDFGSIARCIFVLLSCLGLLCCCATCFCWCFCAEVQKESLKFKKIKKLCYEVNYKENERLSAEETIKIAEKDLEENNDLFCIATNNCENFARKCKTGQSTNTQCNILLKELIFTSLRLALRFLVGPIMSAIVESTGIEWGFTKIQGDLIEASIVVFLTEVLVFVVVVIFICKAYKKGDIEKTEKCNEIGRSGFLYVGGAIGLFFGYLVGAHYKEQEMYILIMIVTCLVFRNVSSIVFGLMGSCIFTF